MLTLTPSQQRNLLGFLQRASITGRDVPAYSELFSLISSAQPLPTPDPAPFKSSAERSDRAHP
jgi:hypothetical protein